MNSHKLIMLPTEKPSEIVLMPIVGLHHSSNPLLKVRECDSLQHFYITSSEEIKIGDYYISYLSNRILQRTKIMDIVESLDKKIVATTDPSLNLPTISESDVKHIIEYYNKNGKLPDIELETIDVFTHNEFMERVFTKKININSFDNTIIFKWQDNKTESKLNICTCNWEKSESGYLTCTGKCKEKYPYRVGRKQGRAVLDSDSHEVVLFPVGKEKEAQEYCDFLNGNYYTKEEVIKVMDTMITLFTKGTEGDIEYNALFEFQNWFSRELSL